MSLQIGLPIFLVCALLQAVVLPRFQVLSAQPDLVLVAVLAWAMLDRDQEGLIWGFAGGLLLDLLSGAPFGLSSLALVIVAYVVSRVEGQVYRASLIPPILLTGAGAAGYHLIYLIAWRLLAGEPVDWGQAALYVALPAVIMDMLLIVPVLQLFARWYDRTHPRQVRI